MTAPDLRESREYDDFSHTVSVFSIAYKHLLTLSDEEDFFTRFTALRLQNMTRFLISIAHGHLLEQRLASHINFMLTNVCQLLGILYEFNQRFNYIEERVWLYPEQVITQLMTEFF